MPPVAVLQGPSAEDAPLDPALDRRRFICPAQRQRLAGVEPVAAIVHFLRDERLLIVFNNCLQVIEAVAALADRILGETGETHMLITSREPLRDAARSEDVAVADDASLFVTGADQGQTGCLTPLTRWRSGLRNLKERGYDRDDDDARQRTTLRKWLPPRFRIAHVLAGRPFLA